ncbi:Uncharacterized protein PBTT_06126 [Plasmodiophora brassicae]
MSTPFDAMPREVNFPDTSAMFRRDDAEPDALDTLVKGLGPIALVDDAVDRPTATPTSMADLYSGAMVDDDDTGTATMTDVSLDCQRPLTASTIMNALLTAEPVPSSPLPPVSPIPSASPRALALPAFSSPVPLPGSTSSYWRQRIELGECRSRLTVASCMSPVMPGHTRGRVDVKRPHSPM